MADAGLALLSKAPGSTPWRAGGGRRFSARFPLKLHEGLSYRYGVWLYDRRANQGVRVRIENRRLPPRLSLRTKQTYST